MNITPRTVMLATDFLQSSRLALDYAVAIAHRFHAEVILMNAFEFGPYGETVELVDHVPCRERRESESRLQALTSGVRKLGLKARYVLLEAPVRSAILKAVSVNKVDLLVLGTQGVHRGFSHLVIGSNTEALMLTSPCPTLTIGPHVHGGIDLDPGFKRILYIADLTPASARLAPYAFALAHDLAVEVEICQLLPDSARDDAGQQQILAKNYCTALTSYLPEVDERSCRPEFQLNSILSSEEIRDRAMDTSALILLGVQPETSLGRHLHTSLAYRLLAEAASPILTLPYRG